MLKSARFLGFDSKPELKAHFERLLPDLESEVGRWADRVEVAFELKHADSDRPFVWLSLSLTLPHVSGEDSAVAAFADVEKPSDFRKWVRFVWGNVLDKLLEKRAEQTEKELAESQGG
ncbi:MAG TPA: hypothetical protein VM533_12895 [Fimbriiglobus sp.]|jgi:ribosomal protein L1|nr:hypothetical protein [Fimbriiglobus sp.]